MRVLISGAGIAGPTLAHFLAKAGAHITVLEKSHTLLSQGQNVDIEGSARHVIKKMGLTEQVLQSNTTEKGTQFIDPKGRPFAPFPVREGFGVSPTSEFEILRGDLAVVLYESTKNHPNVKYLFGTTIEKVISNSEDNVQVKLSTGEIQEYDLLVAADGQWSKVRRQCFAPEDVKVVDMDMYIGYWTIPRLPSDNDLWNIYVALQSRILTLRPDPHGTIRAMITRMPCTDEQRKAWQAATRSDRQTQQDLLKKEFADAGWQAQRFLGEMDRAPDFYFQAAQQIRMTQWSKSRVICLGDAAFAPTSLTGMGTSLAILGAYVLAGELSKLQEGEHISKALDAYEATFRPFVEETQKVPSFVPGFAHPATWWKRWLLQTGLSALAWIFAFSWIAKFAGGRDDVDFPLPQYPIFEVDVQIEASND